MRVGSPASVERPAGATRQVEPTRTPVTRADLRAAISRALERTDGPTVLCLTRQNLPQLRTKANESQSARGAYELLPAEGGKAQATIFASGSEVEIAVAARKLLAEKGVHARVVSVPSLELFLAQDEAYRKKVLPAGTVDKARP